MTVWDVLTWVTIAVLGPGALVILIVFLRSLVTAAPASSTGDDDDRPSAP